MRARFRAFEEFQRGRATQWRGEAKGPNAIIFLWTVSDDYNH